MNQRTSRMDRHQQTYPLPDGRTLRFAEYGHEQGAPLFYFHGWPSSRIEFSGLHGEEIARRLRLRVYAVDRPGFGLSSYQTRHRFTDWPRDIACLADY
jgi:pimeloyl-ACP methyl ester carboxylesterase